MTKFIILSTQRSGTEMLRRALDYDDRIVCAGEILLGKPEYLGRAFIDHFFSIADYMIKQPDAFGAKVMFNQVNDDTLNYILGKFKVIFLKRDIESIIKSNYINRHKSEYHGVAHSTTPTQHFDVRVPRDFVRTDRERILSEYARIGDKNVFTVSYEELSNDKDTMFLDHQASMKVISYLNIAPRPLFVPILKQN